MFAGKHLCWSLIKFHAFKLATLLRSDSSTCIFLFLFHEVSEDIYFVEHMQTAPAAFQPDYIV